MILMPELCYYCREELNFGDMTLHDGHRVHKKCLPTMTTTNEWDEAVWASGNDLVEIYGSGDGIASGNIIREIIAKHFAELKATHEKLVELAVLYRQRNAITSGLHNASLTDGIKRSADALLINQRIDVLEIDPQVKAAIERGKG